ncbi:MAG: GGDEF domain-containing protein, partial [Pseudomonadota bacterium]
MLTKPWERRLAGFGIACFGVGNFVLSVHFDLIGRLYDFSRDGAYGFLSAEAILLAVNLTPVVLLGLVLKTIQLKSALKSQAATEAKAIRISLTDPLTGLGNRRALFRHIDSLAKINWRRSEGHVTTMIVDLDRFKPVNDLHGHAIGDAVLVEVARRIERQLSADDFVARLGGDEFAIVLRKGSTISRCEALADLIIKAVSKPFGKGITAISVGASIGISRSPIKDASNRCLTTADQALYVAKRSGRGSFAWYSDKLETAARKARSKVSQPLPFELSRSFERPARGS